MFPYMHMIDKPKLSGQLKILDLAANGGINPNTGVAWAEGDKYRFMFISDGTRNASSASIADYNTFVQDAAIASADDPLPMVPAGERHEQPKEPSAATSADNGLGAAPPLTDSIARQGDSGFDVPTVAPCPVGTTRSGGAPPEATRQ